MSNEQVGDIRAALEDAAQNNHQRQHDNSDLWRFHKTESWRDCDDHECKRYRDVLATAVDPPPAQQEVVRPVGCPLKFYEGMNEEQQLNVTRAFFAGLAAVDPPPDVVPQQEQEIEPITAGEIRTGLLDTFAIHKDDVFYRLKARVDPPPDTEPRS